MSTPDRVMLLIDADNVSVDVMEQAVRLLLNQHGALHVRRAYCTAECAVANQAVFKRLSIKPMVNLAAGKNSTDIAMAVDAIDLVLAERPDVVVIASSDSDFAPLVQRLREKGCVVRGIGQQGKTGDETQAVYDDFTVLEHRRSSGAAPDAAPARRGARKTAAAAAGPTARTPAVKTAARKRPAPGKAASTTAASKTARTTPQTTPQTTAQTTARTTARTTVRKSPARKTALAAGTNERVPATAAEALPPTSLSAENSAPADSVAAPVPTFASGPPPAASPEAAARTGERPARGAASMRSVLDCLPELAAGQGLALNVAVKRLREAQLLGKNSSSLKLFSQLSDQFELLPANKPSQVRLRR